MPSPKKIILSVSDFAQPDPVCGSIEVLSVFGPAMDLGRQQHQRIQQEHKKNSADYLSEIEVKHTFAMGQLRLEVKGRLDGLFAGPPPRIEEIKASFSFKELRQALQNPYQHPYGLQLLTYGYLYFKQKKELPELHFLLVSLRNQRQEKLQITLDVSTYEAWLERRLQTLAKEILASQKRQRRRKKLAQALLFPFSLPRPGQLELIHSIEAAISEKRPLMIQAATGLGKTMGVIYPTLQDALKRGQRLIYLTPKNSQHLIAQEAVEKLRESAPTLKTLTITSKEKMCLKDEVICNPEYCEFARDHYSKVADQKLLAKLAKKRRLTGALFKKLGRTHEVCPFELQLDASTEADVVICDYNYAFAPFTAFGRLAANPLGQQGRPNLVIDEAHNLAARAMDYYSPGLSTNQLEKLRPALAALSGVHRARALHLLEDGLAIVQAPGKNSVQKNFRVELALQPFLDLGDALRELLSHYLAQDGNAQAISLLEFNFLWSSFTAGLQRAAEEKAFFTTFQRDQGDEQTQLKITCCDAGPMLAKRYEDYHHVVAFSATLRPFEYYARLMGLHRLELKTAEFVSPFPRTHRKLLLIPQVSSKYSQRGRNYPRMAQIISKITGQRRGNYLAFFPSFEFLEKVAAYLQLPPGFSLFKQERSLKKEQIQILLRELQQPQSAQIVLGVQGGMLAEGIDYAGSMAVGAFIVGAALPQYGVEREEMKNYYEQTYGQGAQYAYHFPAMAKAIQAAGRVIRSEHDCGLIVLMDERFAQESFALSMPQDWFERSPQELVSSSILADVQKFWDSTSAHFETGLCEW